MTSKPLRPCNHPGCSALSKFSYCDAHKPNKAENTRFYDKFKRNKAHDNFYHSVSWKKCREYIRIRDLGLCKCCLEDKRITIGTIVDHIIPLKVSWDKRLDENNLQLLCTSCHNIKTAEDMQKY